MDDTVLIIARCALALVFVVSAVAKLLDREGSIEALSAFSVPSKLHPAAAIGLPVAELGVALALLPASSAVVGGMAASALLAAFTAGIANALRVGRTPACHCFGALSAEPIGPATLVRNVALLLLAALIVMGGGGPSIARWADQRDATEVWLTVTAGTSVLLGVLHARLLLAERRARRARLAPPDFAPQLEIGAPAPAFDLRTTDGVPVTSEVARGPGRAFILVFISTTCGPCHELLPSLARWQRQLEGRLDLHVVSAGGRKENLEMSQEHGVRILVDERSSTNTAYRVPGTPSAIEIDAEGRVASLQHPGGPAIEGLIRAALKRAGLGERASPG